MSAGIQVGLLVTDVGLRGGTSGRQLVDAARQQDSTLPVIFITGFAGEEALAGEDVIGKLFDTANLAGLIAEKLS